MTKKDFLFQLRRGLGSAIIELQENSERDKYYEIVLRCCLKNIAYDKQVEGTKSYYLYTAICALGRNNEIEDVIVNAYTKRLNYGLFMQLTDILYLYAEEGSEKARNALHKKYQSLLEQLSKQRGFPIKYCEREQFEYLMICEVTTNKWTTFKKCISDAGYISMSRNDDRCNCYDWFLSRSRNVFGKKRIDKYISTASNKTATIGAFIAAVNELEKEREKHSLLRIEPIVSLESYNTRARELEKDEYSYERMYFSAMRFSRQASQKDLLELTSIIINELSYEIKANLLRVFRYIDFPADIAPLLEYAKCDFECLYDIAVDALGRFKDQRVHDLAIQYLLAGNLDHGLHLLIRNWHKKDELLIRERVLSTRKITHSMQQSLRDIYMKYRSKSCGDILEHAYRCGECTHCRTGIIEAMWKNRVLKTSILNECLYDSNDDTRRIAERIKKVCDKNT